VKPPETPAVHEPVSSTSSSVEPVIVMLNGVAIVSVAETEAFCLEETIEDEKVMFPPYVPAAFPAMLTLTLVELGVE
jgi:hypothetical protein